ncbi:MAG TPA: DUF2934 domain-containing protein [Bryobacteraceae bacterium]|nr:DUF2934 domain-containing protein [Bryobacteraceae bacterium]
MPQFSDHDGKSKTASAVDSAHYPEIDINVDSQEPAHGDIAKLAHELWVQQGRPSGTSERDWLEAENQLRRSHNSQASLQKIHEKSGSVQP